MDNWRTEQGMAPLSLHVYGDSILKGIVMNRDNGQYIPMKEDDFAPLAREMEIDIVNKSKFGYTIGRGWTFLSRALQNARQKNVKLCDVLLLEYGGNDCNFDWRAISENPTGEHLPITPISEFTKMLREMIASLREVCVTPILMTLPPIHAKRYFERICETVPGTVGKNILTWLGGDAEMIYRYQELYSNTVTRIAYETGSPLIDVRGAFLDKHNYASLLCEDGIHPNEAGHALIAEAILSAKMLFAEGNVRAPARVMA